MRFFAMVIALVLSVVTANAEPITREQARKQAEKFMSGKKRAVKLEAVTSVKKLAPARRAGARKTTASEYYIFNKGIGEGFLIVSGDDSTLPILGYCDEGEFDYEKLPPQLQDLLDDYARQIAAIQAGAPVVRVPQNHPKVETLLTCKWSQGSPYNNLCPMDGANRSVTGCVATAIAQILYHHREKSVTETTADMPAYTTNSKSIHVSGIEAGAPIDWANMKDTYNSATDLQKKAVAQLMLYCGVAVKMDYTSGASAAYSNDAYQAFAKYFGYGSSVRYVTYQDVSSDDDWDRIVYAEMEAGRPVYVSGSNAEAGHAFVACGYENQRYWINWGWGGQSDGYYYLSNLTPGDGQGIGGSPDGYNGYKEIVVGIEPENYGEKAMSFSDAAVKSICIEKFDTNGDGVLTYGEAAEVTDLGDAFKGNVNIKRFPELHYFTSLTRIADYAFDGCAQLASIRLPKSVKQIGEAAFRDCHKLPQVNMPVGVDEIGAGAFDGCKVLEAIELPVGLTILESRTFRNCAAITDIDLPISVMTIKEGAFAGCTRLKSFTVNTYRTGELSCDKNVFEGVDLGKATLHVMQGTKAFFDAAEQWKEFGQIVQTRDISGGKFTALETGNTYYLYHVGTGRYLTRGEAYKTQAVVGTEPMRFKFVHPTSKPEGVYYITSPDTGNEGKYLFRTTTDGNVGQGVKATFVDGTTLNDAAYWTVTDAGNDMYTIQSTTAGQHEFLGVQTDHESSAASPTYGAYWDVEDGNANTMWQFVLYDELQSKTFAEAETLAKLLATAKKRGLMTTDEQAVYDNLDSSVEELKAAQSSLRKKLKFIEFSDQEVGQQFIAYFDSDTDGELSYKEASDITDFGWLFTFMNNTKIVNVDELQYFTNAQTIPGCFLQGCVNLESVVLPKGLEKIYYWAFKGCRKLKSINIPEYVNTIGENAFDGCTALRSVTLGASDPSFIYLGTNVFAGVNLANCTLYVPYGSKELYEQAEVWKKFGKVVEVRGRVQPKYSPIEVNVPGYIMNVATRKFITLGEAYGTQSIVARNGIQYQFKKTSSMGEGTYYLYSSQTGQNGNVLFRTSTDTKVGTGVKACFGDGTASASAYWQLADVGDNIFTLQVPQNNATYVEGEYLGVDEYHDSNVASPTYGLYWDVKGRGTLWAFVRVEDMEEAKVTNDMVDRLAELLKKAGGRGLETIAEQAVYDNPESTLTALEEAVESLRSKLHYITFADAKAQSLCVEQWDADGDGELSIEEAAAVKSIGETFRGASMIKSFEELRYFTSITEIPENAFRGALTMKTIYLPAGVKTIGEYAFTNCSSLENIVILNDEDVVPMGVTGISNGTNLYVPTAIINAYENDEAWPVRCTIKEYTGKPVVTATASRSYGRQAASIKVLVEGAPVDGEPVCTCDLIKELSVPVGTYPITVEPGTITTKGVEYREGVFTVEPATLTVAAKSYTRSVGETNPVFELTYRGFRNKEKEDVLISQPQVTCEATAESPAGEYEIVVSGGEAQNYKFTYVSGILTVVESTGIGEVKVTEDVPVYDLQGRRVTKPGKGVYVKGHKKIIAK